MSLTLLFNINHRQVMPDAADVIGFFKRKPSNAVEHQIRFAKMQKIKMNHYPLSVVQN